VVTISPRDGNSLIVLVVTGQVPWERIAWTECACVVKNWSKGSGESHAFKKWNFWESLSS